jgi:hypothetical protein
MSGEETKKLSFDSNDFKFSVAYQAYEKAFDEAAPDNRETLNDVRRPQRRGGPTIPLPQDQDKHLPEVRVPRRGA